MDFYSMEQFEIMGDAMEEVREWELFEADMASHPYDECEPSEEDIDRMSMTWQDHLWE